MPPQAARNEQMSKKFMELFRPQALDAYRTAHGDDGDVLRLSPRWIRWTFPTVIAIALTGFVLLCVLRTHQYASGPAVVRAADRTDLTSLVSGVVEAVTVRPGQAVAAGDTLIRLEARLPRAEFARLEREYEQHMTDHLRDPANGTARQTVASLRAQLDVARRDLASYFIRAPHAGVVQDVRTRPGHQLVPGQVAATLIAESPELFLIAMLPGHFRPELSDSLSSRFMPAGYRHSHQELEIRSINDEIVGPAEARRYVGSEVADAVDLTGPVVVVETHLPPDGFRDGTRTLAYHDGMQGTLEVKLESKPIILALMPALKNIREASHE